MKKIFIGVNAWKAIFVMASFVLLSCEKSTGSLGLDLVVDDKAVLGIKRDIPIRSYTIDFDSINSTNAFNDIVGFMQDPAFGGTSNEFVSQFMLSQTSPDFGDNPIVDSAKLVLVYAGYYGDTNQLMKIEILELDEELDLDSGYYSNNEFSATFKVGDKRLLPQPKTRTFFEGEAIGAATIFDIDTGWASQKIIKGAKDNEDAFADNEEFVKYFNGLKFTSNKTGNSALYYDVLAKETKLRIYYREHKDSTETLKFDLISNTSGTSVNTGEFNYTTAEFDLNNQDTTNGELDTYVQSMGSVATLIDLDSLKPYRDSSFIVNKAELVLRVKQGSTNGFAPPDQLLLIENKNGNRVFVKDFILAPSNFGGYLETDPLREMKYTFNISLLIHDYLNSDANINDIMVIPVRSSAHMDRVILGGNQNPFIPMEFNLYFTRTKE